MLSTRLSLRWYISLIWLHLWNHHSDCRLRSLVSTLLFSDRPLSTSALQWVKQSKPSQALVWNNSVVILLSLASRTLFSCMCWIHLLDVQWCTNPLGSPDLGISSIHQLVRLHNPVWLSVIVSLQFYVLPDRPDLLLALVGGQLEHKSSSLAKGRCLVIYPVSVRLKLHMSIMALFCCSCLSFFKVFEVGSPISISRSCFSQVSVLSTSRDSRDFPVFSPTTVCYGNPIISVRTSSDGWLCSTWMDKRFFSLQWNEQQLQILKKV